MTGVVMWPLWIGYEDASGHPGVIPTTQEGADEDRIALEWRAEVVKTCPPFQAKNATEALKKAQEQLR